MIQGSRFPFCQKKLHEAGLKVSGHYLLVTRNKGLIITSTRNLNVDAYPDADVAGQIFWGAKMEIIYPCTPTQYVMLVDPSLGAAWIW